MGLRLVAAAAAALAGCSSPNEEPIPSPTSSASTSVASASAGARNTARDAAPATAALRVDAAGATAALDAGMGAPSAGALAIALARIAYIADADVADVRTALDRAIAAGTGPDDHFSFGPAREDPDEARTRLARIERVLTGRRDVIETKVRRLLDEEVAASMAPLDVALVFGLPSETPIGLVPGEVGGDARAAERVVLIDAWALGELSDDLLGERLTRRLAPELFYLHADRLSRPRPVGEVAVSLDLALTEGVGAWLALAPQERFDDQGRRRPERDLRARDALARFEENVAAAVTGDVTSDLLWAMANGPREERWGTWAFALMIDAVDRFERPGRLRELLGQGPAALVEAYGALAGRLATVPPIGPATRERVERLMATRPPNIVFVMVDDMGWADVGCYGGRVVQTPRIDALAAAGMRFTDAYSGSVVCAPARSVLMTGRHAGHTSVRLNTGGVPLRDEDVTVAEVLRDAGYAVGGFGKWGLGEIGTSGVPERQGFDVFFGYYHQIHAHRFLPDYLVRNSERVPLDGNRGFYEAQGKGPGAFPRVDAASGLSREFSAERIAEETLAWIRGAAAGEDPFFCYAAWTPPHGEYLMPDDDPAWLAYADRDWPMKARVVAAYDAWLDAQVGRVVDLLDELGVADDTLVMFASDHGADARFEGILDSCGPLRGKKRDVHEGGIRVPLIARWPGRIEAGAESSHLCAFYDVLPTFAELAGVTPLEIPGGIDGNSFAPTLLGRPEAQAQHDYLYWEWDRYDWGKRRLAEGGRMQAVRRGRYKAVRMSADAALELYDLDADIGEQNDLASEQTEVAAELAALMAAAHVPMRPQEEPQRVDDMPYR